MPRPGLRGRVAIGLVLTAAVALGVAALTLLSPLEKKLRDQELHDLVGTAVQSRASFRELGSRELRPHSHVLEHLMRQLAIGTGARIALLDSAKHVIYNSDPDERDPFRDFAPALGSDRPIRRIVDTGANGEARVAVRVRTEDGVDVLLLRKPLNEQHAAVSAVRQAVGTAALAALAAAFLLAGAFAATSLRRLRRLRTAVASFSGQPGDDDGLPSTRGSDEVSDLTRAFVDLRDRLARQETIRRDFVATASHELRTPLMSLQGRLELLGEDLGVDAPDLSDARRQLSEARTQADRLARLAGDLLDLSRLDARLDLRREPVDVAEVARAVAAEFETRAAERRSAVELDAREPDWALADPGAVAQIMRILLDNALRFSPEGEPVRMTAETDGDRVAVAVHDRGPGVPEEERERIFERFVRGREAPDEGGGFGLGLAIAHELAERMDGRLELAASGPHGTTFRVVLPARDGTSNEIKT